MVSLWVEATEAETLLDTTMIGCGTKPELGSALRIQIEFWFELERIGCLDSKEF